MDNHFKFTNSVVAVPLFCVVPFVYWLESDLVLILIKRIFPRTFSGLQGVF
jgi:hypothetical protein